MARLTRKEQELIATAMALAVMASRRRRRFVVREPDLLERIGDVIYDKIPESIENFADRLLGIK